MIVYIFITFSFSQLKTVNLRQGYIHVSYWLYFLCIFGWFKKIIKKAGYTISSHNSMVFRGKRHLWCWWSSFLMMRTVFCLIIFDLHNLCSWHFHKASHSFLYLSPHATENFNLIKSIILMVNWDAPCDIQYYVIHIIRGWMTDCYSSLLSVIIKNEIEWKKIFRERCIEERLSEVHKLRSGMNSADRD